MHADGERVFLTRAQGVRDVCREGQVAAHVLRDAHVVDVDGACPVYGVQMEHEPFAADEGWRGELATVPQQLVRLELATYSGERGLRREGHPDGLPT